MNVLVVFCLAFICPIGFCFQYPLISIALPHKKPSTVLYGESVRIPVRINYWWMKRYAAWSIPEGSYLERVSGSCLPLPVSFGDYGNGACSMNLVIPGKTMGKTVAGTLQCRLHGSVGSLNNHHWNNLYASPQFSVTVIPHPISLSSIPVQLATANQEFKYYLKRSVKYYDENLTGGKPIQGLVTPTEQDGLHFDPASFAIIGKPQRLGVYSFQVRAKNANATTSATSMTIDVKANPKDKPIFKKLSFITSAMPNQKYTLNLMELIESQQGFMRTNQVHFLITSSTQSVDWLHIAADDGTLLEGRVPNNLAGQEITVTVIATSNTGGDSAPFVVTIPIAYDPSQKPVITSFSLEQEAGTKFSEDLTDYVTDPTQDPRLKLILDKVEPEVSWLSLYPNNPMVLVGDIPLEAAGQQYQLTLKANSVIGGDSEDKMISLRINVDKKLTPRLKAVNPHLPIAYPGQSYFYDFIINQDIYPEYQDAPYEMAFAPAYEPPDWLWIEDNKLLADRVPDDFHGVLDIKIIIKNVPGGQSDVITIPFIVAH